MEHIKTGRKKRIIISGLCCCMGFAVVFAAVCVLLPQQSRSRYISENQAVADETLEEFEAAARLYRTENGERQEVPVTVDENGRQYYDVAAEVFDSLSMDVSYRGNARTYMRIGIETAWYRSEAGHPQLIMHSYPAFAFNEEANVYDNRSRDDYIYLKDVISAEGTDERQLGIIRGVTDPGQDFDDPVNAGDHAERVRIFLTVDCVQFNRVREVWKMERFPWEA